MKRILLYTFVIMTALAMMSNQRGRGQASGPATDAPGENRGTCGNAGCHSSGAFNPELRILMFDENEEAVEKYVPGNTYTVVLKVDATGLPAGYGFQMVSLQDSNDGPTGLFSDLPQDVREVTLLGRQYVEQSRRLPVDSIPIKWTAPEVGTGNVSFYAAANAVDGNGSPGGDGTTNGSFTFEENQGSSVEELDTEVKLELFPNPAFDIVNVSKELNLNLLEVFDLSGRKLGETAQRSFDLNGFQSGTYLSKVTLKNGKILTSLFYKN